MRLAFFLHSTEQKDDLVMTDRLDHEEPQKLGSVDIMYQHVPHTMMMRFRTGREALGAPWIACMS